MISQVGAEGGGRAVGVFAQGKTNRLGQSLGRSQWEAVEGASSTWSWGCPMGSWQLIPGNKHAEVCVLETRCDGLPLRWVGGRLSVM